ncbi:MAG: Rap1a/Tai family immunity protein [Rhodomicrobium sp.]
MKRDNRNRLGIGAFLLFLVSCPPASAEVTAGQLYEFCTSTDEMVKLGCGYFILGAVGGIRLGDSASLGPDGKLVERSPTHFCMPDGVSGPKMVSVFLKLSKLDFMKFPEDTKLSAIVFVDALMHIAYPCSKKK